MKLDYLVASESAFFSDDEKVSIIKIFDTFTLQSKKNLPDKLPPLPAFFISGKVSGDYGEGLRVLLFSPSGELVMKETAMKASALNQPHFNFIINVLNLVAEEEGDYSATIKDFTGKTTLVKDVTLFKVSYK